MIHIWKGGSHTRRSKRSCMEPPYFLYKKTGINSDNMLGSRGEDRTLDLGLMSPAL